MNTTNIDFFIVGYPRSGTTLAASLLARNPDIYVSPETHFFRHFQPCLKNADNKEEFIRKFMNDTRLSDLNIEKDILDEFDPEIHRPSWLLSKAMEHKAKKAGKSIIGEKTPPHLMFYKSILQEYPETRFIVILRDGRDCVFSNIKEKWTFSSPIKHAAEWNYYMDHYYELLDSHPDKVLTIRYEDILDNPEQSVQLMTQFVGGTYVPQQIEDDKSDDVIPEWEKEWKSNASKKPNNDNKYKWKNHKDKNLLESLTLIMRNNLNKNNYSIYPLEDMAFIRRLHIYIRYFIYISPIYPTMKSIASNIIYKKIKNLLN